MKIRFEIELPELVIDENPDGFGRCTDDEIEQDLSFSAWCDIELGGLVRLNQDDLKEFIKQVRLNKETN